MQELTTKQKLTNYYYFIIFNSLLACIIGIGYWFRLNNAVIFQLSELDILYVITTHIAIICLIVFAVSLTILPTIYLKPKKATLMQLILFSILLTILVCDVRVFQVDQVHIFSITLNTLIDIITTNEAIFTINKAIACAGIIILLWLIYKTKQWIDKTNYLTSNTIGFIFSLLLLTSATISVLSYQLATKEKQQHLLNYMQYLPLNNKNKNLVKNIYTMIENNKLQYPLKPLETTAITNPPNILIIGIDAWRADCFNKNDSPNLWKFAQSGKIFTNHFSGSNHTLNGLFSLFYGVHAIYLNKFQQHQIPALFFSRLKQLDYQIDCFANNKDEWLKFFTDIKNLHKQNKNITKLYKIDQQATQNWLNWHTNLDKTKPWFSFIFYDSLHGPNFPENYSIIAKPAMKRNYKEFANEVGRQGFINSYKTSIHYIDSLANEILTQLKKKNNLDNTIVIITADHGCEWNDNDQGQYGYWSNFTDCQIKVPLAIILPKQFQEQLFRQQNNLTTHYDVVPTLMKNFLGVKNIIADYSIGNDLLDNNNIRECFLACSLATYISYSSNAIIATNNVLKISSSGIINQIDNFNQLIFDKTINVKYLDQALEYMTRFIKK